MATPNPDTKKQAIARANGMRGVPDIALASTRSGLQFYNCLAIIEGETHGDNVYGGDRGGVFSHVDLKLKSPKPVTDANFMEFLARVVMDGEVSNGVGPGQATYAGATNSSGMRDGGHFYVMMRQGLRPWVPAESMTYLFIDFKKLMALHGPQRAAEIYNGGYTDPISPAAAAYGRAFMERRLRWRRAFGLVK